MTAGDHQPAHLPADEADLAEWSVYADHLMTIGDRRGELIARELALSAEVERAPLAAFHAHAQTVCRKGRRAHVGWCLGHARELAILPRSGRLGPSSGPGEGTLAHAHDFLRAPVGRLIESLAIAYCAGEHARHWRRLLGALPPTCTRLVIALPRPMPGEFDALCALLPAHVTTIAIDQLRTAGAGARASGVAPRADLARLVTDRFSLVDLSRLQLVDADLALLDAALATTTAVRLHVGVCHGTGPSRRTRGAPDAAGLVQPQTGHAVVLPRYPLLALQQLRGVIPVRAQLARTLGEGHELNGDADTLITSPRGGDLVRRGDAWTLRGFATATYVDDVAIAPAQVVPLRDGAHIRSGALDCVFVATAVDAHATELHHDRRR